VRRARLVALAVALTLAGLGIAWALGGATARAQAPPTVSRAQGAPSTDEIGDEVQTVPRGRLPVFAATSEIGALYRFATTRDDVLRWMPCTCGCAQLGHTSNRSCYVKAESDASVTYTSHAAT